MPRIVGRQKHRANASASTPFNYYLRNMCLPFLEHLIEGLNTRFNKYASMIYNMHAFVRSLVGMGNIEENDKTVEIIHKYKDDLSTPGNVFE